MTQIGNPNGAKEKYSIGKDTYKRFGDGRIQIVWSGSNSKILWDCDNKMVLLNSINLWVKKKNTILFEGLRNKKHCIIKYSLDDHTISIYEKTNF